MKRLMLILPLLIFVGMFFVMADMLSRDRNPSEIKSVLIGKPAPEFSLPSLDGSFKVDQKFLKSTEPIVVNFWASWCIPCLAEHAFLTDMQEKGIPILGIAYQDEPKDSEAFLVRLGDPFAATVSDFDGRNAVNWGVYGVPETFIVDRSGIIRYKHFGPITEDRYNELLKAYEAAKSPLTQGGTGS